jgi:hypothetical protein
VPKEGWIEDNPVKDNGSYRLSPMTGRTDIEPCHLYKRALAKQTLKEEPRDELDYANSTDNALAEE